MLHFKFCFNTFRDLSGGGGGGGSDFWTTLSFISSTHTRVIERGIEISKGVIAGIEKLDSMIWTTHCHDIGFVGVVEDSVIDCGIWVILCSNRTGGASVKQLQCKIPISKASYQQRRILMDTGKAIRVEGVTDNIGYTTSTTRYRPLIDYLLITTILHMIEFSSVCYP